ncbi:hypothetical protein [Streptomyces sp. CB01881]|uniref:hypothetical protein n=1 Tax=Streptomyces sp. CB01881 TaxID=2078691 RepID=UPI0011DF2283|nr:hypothetical protein [Streptomyces sp. CB01881]
MTSAVPFSRPAPPEGLPGDAERAPRELMTLPGASRDVRRWRLVEIRLGGRGRPGLLTVWRRPPGSTRWVVHVRWGDDVATLDGQAWGWFLYSEETVRPLPEPAVGPYFGRWRDAVTVPSEMAGSPDPGGADRCWRLAWVLTAGRWHSGLVTARRRPGPGPWIAHVRWGEDAQAAWVIADTAVLQPVPADTTSARPGAQSPAPAAAGADRKAR